jgi:hypothetical protein
LLALASLHSIIARSRTEPDSGGPAIGLSFLNAPQPRIRFKIIIANFTRRKAISLQKIISK